MKVSCNHYISWQTMHTTRWKLQCQYNFLQNETLLPYKHLAIMCPYITYEQLY